VGTLSTEGAVKPSTSCFIVRLDFLGALGETWLLGIAGMKKSDRMWVLDRAHNTATRDQLLVSRDGSLQSAFHSI